MPVYAGTGAESTREAVRLTKMAEREGVQGVSVITPYFVNPSQQEIADHYRRIAENTSLPVILYNNPSTCGGVKIDVDTVGRLAEIPNILGIKDSSGDLQNTNEYLRGAGAFQRIAGPGYAHLSGADFRARGAVPATANVAPRVVVDIYEAAQRGDHAAAKAAQLKLNPVRLSLTLGTAPGGVKAALAVLAGRLGRAGRPWGRCPRTSSRR